MEYNIPIFTIWGYLVQNNRARRHVLWKPGPIGRPSAGRAGAVHKRLFVIDRPQPLAQDLVEAILADVMNTETAGVIRALISRQCQLIAVPRPTTKQGEKRFQKTLY